MPPGAPSLPFRRVRRRRHGKAGRPRRLLRSRILRHIILVAKEIVGLLRRLFATGFSHRFPLGPQKRGPPEYFRKLSCCLIDVREEMFSVTPFWLSWKRRPPYDVEQVSGSLCVSSFCACTCVVLFGPLRTDRPPLPPKSPQPIPLWFGLDSGGP